MRAICTDRCFYGGREWLVGEAFEVGEGEIPTHFRAATDADQVDENKLKRVAPTFGAPQPEVDSAFTRALAGEAVALSEISKPKQTISEELEAIL